MREKGSSVKRHQYCLGLSLAGFDATGEGWHADGWYPLRGQAPEILASHSGDRGQTHWPLGPHYRQKRRHREAVTVQLLVFTLGQGYTPSPYALVCAVPL